MAGKQEFCKRAMETFSNQVPYKEYQKQKLRRYRSRNMPMPNICRNAFWIFFVTFSSKSECLIKAMIFTFHGILIWFLLILIDIFLSLSWHFSFTV